MCVLGNKCGRLFLSFILRLPLTDLTTKPYQKSGLTLNVLEERNVLIKLLKV